MNSRIHTQRKFGAAIAAVCVVAPAAYLIMIESHERETTTPAWWKAADVAPAVGSRLRDLKIAETHLLEWRDWRFVWKGPRAPLERNRLIRHVVVFARCQSADGTPKSAVFLFHQWPELWPDSGWLLSDVHSYHIGYRSSWKIYDGAPSREDVESLLQEWKWLPITAIVEENKEAISRSFVGGEIVEEAWLEMCGDLPSYNLPDAGTHF